ncbi:MAG: biosynthetic arginine decarboxylase [Gemmatimonas sp.]|nr:biosynthetic arginine decarboxylase [Gemmatimonas sp.]
MTADRAWTIDDALALYNVEGWGIGYFGINEHGHVTVHPTRDPNRSLDLYELSQDLAAQGVSLPLLLRFSDILRTRVESLATRFEKAIAEFEYEGTYTTVYPIKVNQQRHVVEEILDFGGAHGVGIEVGSKPELQAALALSERTDHIIVCNGYKDEEFIRLALMGQKLGHRVFIVIEKINEVDLLLSVAEEMEVVPTAGVRIKLASTGSGKWAATGGERSKFGLNASQLMRVLEKLEGAGRLDTLKLIHFHLGSQIPDIRNVKAAMAEVSRYYVELRQVGVAVDYVDVGGGLGVDYDGSRSTANASVNYSVQEYANDIIYSLAEACREREVPMPNVISESGRALTAHHAMLLFNVIGLETQIVGELEEIPEQAHSLVHELAASLEDPRNPREVFHDAVFAKEQAQLLFNSGVLSLGDRALVERLHLAVMNRIARLAAADPEEFDDIIPELDLILTDRYFCNFSLFQSLPDSWAIDQVFPIMPIHRLTEEPTQRGTLQDVTCDSDGKIDRFAGGRDGKPTLELHAVANGDSYILGIFLTGAYQEILGDLHNLFGDTNAVHIRLSSEASRYEITDLVHGDTTTEVLNYVQFDAQTLVATFRRKVQRAKGISRSESNAFIADYIEGLAGYTYLEGA